MHDVSEERERRKAQGTNESFNIMNVQEAKSERRRRRETNLEMMACAHFISAIGNHGNDVLFSLSFTYSCLTRRKEMERRRNISIFQYFIFN